tara:strand:+ start:4149 stop:4487 length:339 start_codon:yes stop_codon:yes gene_type:complete
MKPIIIENSVIPKLLSVFINIGAITLWPFIICRSRLDLHLLNHESIHIKQQQELLLVGFYFLYVYYWLKGLWRFWDARLAYYSIPFEQEAYEHEYDLNYLENRKFWAWRHYR